MGEILMPIFDVEVVCAAAIQYDHSWTQEFVSLYMFVMINCSTEDRVWLMAEVQKLP